MTVPIRRSKYVAQIANGARIHTTFTFNNRYYFMKYKSARTAYRDTICWLLRKLSKCCKCFTIVPELTQRGVLHYHCVAWVSDNASVYKDMIFKWESEEGNTYTVTCEHPVVFKHFYLRKDNKGMAQVLGYKNPWDVIINETRYKGIMREMLLRRKRM